MSFLCIVECRGRYTVSLLLLTCVLGFGLSYFGWNCRRVISATAFALLGIANKVLSLIAAGWYGPMVIG